MQDSVRKALNNLYVPPKNSHKGQNGKLLLIGGSHLFHAASLWSLKIASKIVDMVFYSSVPDNNSIVLQAKEEFRDGIVIPRDQLDSYVRESDCILIGPGMVRLEKMTSIDLSKSIQDVKEIQEMHDEGMQTYFLTKYMLMKYPHKKWVLDAGALQMIDPHWLSLLHGNVIVTPHRKEFAMVFSMQPTPKTVYEMAKKYNCIILVKGQEDIVCSPTAHERIGGGNVGMTKGGTGDVLAGLTGALSCKSDMFTAAVSASFFNKKAGDSLYKRKGPYYNASDLVEEIPFVMHKFLHEEQ